jgi:hypothetical protein
MEVEFFKTSFYPFVATYLTRCKEIWWFFLNFGRILAIENLKKKALNSSTFNFSISFWLYIAIKKESLFQSNKYSFRRFLLQERRN